MMQIAMTKVSIRIDLKWGRIALSSKALNAISEPKFILLLINTDEQTLVVMGCDETVQDAQRVRHSKKNETMFFSKGLIRNLSKLCPSWQSGGSYRIDGNIVHGEKYIEFKIDNALLLNETKV